MASLVFQTQHPQARRVDSTPHRPLQRRRMATHQPIAQTRVTRDCPFLFERRTSSCVLPVTWGLFAHTLAARFAGSRRHSLRRLVLSMVARNNEPLPFGISRSGLPLGRTQSVRRLASGHTLHRIAWLSLTIVAVGWLAVEIPLADSPLQTPCGTDWRRTRDGWQRRSEWVQANPPASHRLLHPVLIGLAQLLIATTSLVAFSPTAIPHHRGWENDNDGRCHHHRPRTSLPKSR